MAFSSAIIIEFFHYKSVHNELAQPGRWQRHKGNSVKDLPFLFSIRSISNSPKFLNSLSSRHISLSLSCLLIRFCKSSMRSTQYFSNNSVGSIISENMSIEQNMFLSWKLVAHVEASPSASSYSPSRSSKPSAKHAGL